MRRSDEDAFAEFVRAHSATLFRTAYLMTGDDQRAEDLLQTTLVRVYQRWTRVGATERPGGYARRVLMSLAASWWRRRSSHESPLVLCDEPSEGARMEGVAEHERVWRAVLTLPPPQRGVTVLRHYEELTEAQIADALAMALDTVQNHGDAAAVRLAELLGGARRWADPTRNGSDVMTLDARLTQAVRRVAEGVVVPELDLDAVRSRARADRRRAVGVAVASALVTMVVAGAVVAGRDTRAPEPVEPVRSPRIVGTGPVWYDAMGLHHGGHVEQTAVDLFEPARGGGALALVRGGALYRDPTTNDVWFHPWNGEPRVVGHDSMAGPGGDPEGDVAAWFEGHELVVYDTARGREISRTPDVPVRGFEREWVGGGNGFRHVSAEGVVWRSQYRTHRFDVATGTPTVEVEVPGDEGTSRGLVDESNALRVWYDYELRSLSIDVAGRAERSFPTLYSGRLSASGAFLLSPSVTDDSLGAALVDVRTGEMWKLPGEEFYASISWSYGDLALVMVNQVADRGAGTGTLLACDAVTRECDRLPTYGNVLLPTS